MPAKPKVVVIGSAGLVGAATVQALSSRYGEKYRVVAATLNPDSHRAQDLKSLPGVDVQRGSLEDEATLGPLVAGAAAVFVVTPGAENRAELAARGIRAAAAARVSLVAVVSVQYADFPEDLLFGKQLSAVEAAAKAAGVPYCILRLALFNENFLFSAGSIKAGKLYGSSPPGAESDCISVADIGAAAAEVLAHPASHANTTYTLTSGLFSHAKLAALLSAATGTSVEYVQVPYEASREGYLAAGMPAWQTDGLLQAFKFADAGNIPTADPSDFRGIAGRDATTLEAWVQAHAEAFKN